jgi:hypothetical protein
MKVMLDQLMEISYQSKFSFRPISKRNNGFYGEMNTELF